MFRGANAISLDAKGRLAMPSRYRDELVSRSSGQLIVTIDAVDPCLCVYPLDEWEIIETKLRALPSLREENRRLLQHIRCRRSLRKDPLEHLRCSRAGRRSLRDAAEADEPELDIPAETIRLKQGGGHGGHNGLRDIIAACGSNDFARVRVGIGRPPGRMDTADFVLKDFGSTERKNLPVTLEIAADAVDVVGFTMRGSGGD